MESLYNCIANHVVLPEPALIEIMDCFEVKSLKKGENWVEAGVACKSLGYIASGFMRLYNLEEGKEITVWIGSEGSFITSLSSFIFELPNFWTIQALTKVELYTIPRHKHFEMLQKHPKWMELDNLLLARAYMLLEKRMMDHLHLNAQQRFEQLRQEQPTIFQYIPQQYIASMLGITPETLSRIRKAHI